MALATTLGRIFPLYGVIEGPNGDFRCECGNPDCGKHAGKHPRQRGWKRQATTNLNLILAWFELYPSANFGVVMGGSYIAVDADVRPEEGKNGVAELEYLEIDHRRRLPHSITVLSGRGNGSKHIFYRLPPGVPLKSLSSPFKAVDLIKNGYCVTPGSRHISGNFYRFETECGPYEQEIAAMPDLLLEEFGFTRRVDSPTRVPLSPNVVADIPFVDFDPPKAVPPGRKRPDWVVERQIRRDPAAGPLFAGTRQSRKKNDEFDRSRDDFSLCKFLAFYTSHHWNQYCRFFEKSAMYGDKPNTDYIKRTLLQAFLANRENWIEKPRKRKSRATGAKRGRRLAPDTSVAIALHKDNRSLTASQIALRIGCAAAKVRNILSRYRNGFYRVVPSHNSVPLTHIGGYLEMKQHSLDSHREDTVGVGSNTNSFKS